MKKYMKAVLSFMLALALTVGLAIVPVTQPAYAASKKTYKMTAYDSIIKSKSTVYCSAGRNLYKVDLNTKSVKLIAETSFGAYQMKLKDGYIYYADGGDITTALYRVKTSGTSKKFLNSIYKSFNTGYSPYVIKDSKIYYYGKENGKLKKRMSLNGKKRKKVSGIKLKMTVKNTNAKGYEIVSEYAYMGEGTWGEDTEYYDCYLHTPQGENIYLGTDCYIR